MCQECIWKPQFIQLGLKALVLIWTFLRESLDGEITTFVSFVLKSAILWQKGLWISVDIFYFCVKGKCHGVGILCIQEFSWPFVCI